MSVVVFKVQLDWWWLLFERYAAGRVGRGMLLHHWLVLVAATVTTFAGSATVAATRQVRRILPSAHVDRIDVADCAKIELKSTLEALRHLNAALSEKKVIFLESSSNTADEIKERPFSCSLVLHTHVDVYRVRQRRGKHLQDGPPDDGMFVETFQDCVVRQTISVDKGKTSPVMEIFIKPRVMELCDLEGVFTHWQRVGNFMPAALYGASWMKPITKVHQARRFFSRLPQCFRRNWTAATSQGAADCPPVAKHPSQHLLDQRETAATSQGAADCPPVAKHPSQHLLDQRETAATSQGAADCPPVAKHPLEHLLNQRRARTKDLRLFLRRRTEHLKREMNPEELCRSAS